MFFFCVGKGKDGKGFCVSLIKPSVSLTKALLNPYFGRGGTLGGWLISHHAILVIKVFFLRLEMGKVFLCMKVW